MRKKGTVRTLLRPGQIAKIMKFLDRKVFLLLGLGIAVNAAIALLLAIFMFRILPGTTLLSTLVFAGLYPLLKVLNRRISKLAAGTTQSWVQMSDRMMMGIRNLLLLHIYGLEEREEQVAVQRLTEYRKYARGFHLVAGVVALAPQFLGILLLCGIVLVSREHLGVATGVLITYF